jgi:transcriptional regulator
LYIPSHFAETDIPTLHAGIEDIAFGALVANTESGLEANHLPFELDRSTGEFGVLRCHVARNNALWRGANGAQCLIIFHGPSGYISPNLYVTKKEHGKVVPTYNYVAIHAHGRMTVHDDVKWLRGLVGRLTNRFEVSQPKPWTIGDAPQEYIDERLKEIVGIEIEITRVEGKWKMSQNRPEADRKTVVDGLTASVKHSDREIAALVRERSAKLL